MRDQAAIADGDGVGEDEMDRLLDAEQERLRAEGY